MIVLDLPTNTNEEPVGKRTVRGNVWGNLKGYVGGRYWTTFGDRWSETVQREAEEWRLREILPAKKTRKAKP